MYLIKPFVFVAINLLLNCVTLRLSAQTNFISNSNSKFTIIIPYSQKPYQQAAETLQSMVKRSTGVQLAINTGTNNCNNCIVINTLDDAQRKGLYKDIVLKNDGLLLDTRSTTIFLIAQDTSTLDYPVYEFLSQNFDAACFKPGDVSVPKQTSVKLSNKLYTYNPPFYYRDVYYNEAFDYNYQRWNRVKHIQSGNKEWGNFVHTMGQFISFDNYFKTNPEYFALVNGKRMASQVCYSNPDVYRIVKQNLLKIIQQQPDKKVWSVSQMDNNDFCQCDKCTTLNKKYGSPSGAMIYFVNSLAKEIPDKTISTLAYGATMQAPRNITLSPNLNIVFCVTYGNKVKNITTDPASRDMVNSLNNWGGLTKNIIIWDYVVNFKNLLTPLPNYFILADNIRYYQKIGAKGVFLQGDAQAGGEFSGLRAYLLSWLLWNPQLNDNDLMKQYADYTYGPASGDVLQLMRSLSQAANGVSVSNYDDPAAYSGNIFSTANAATYQALYDNATKKVSASSSYFKALAKIGVAIDYTQIEIVKKRLPTATDKAAVVSDLKTYQNRLAASYALDPTASAINEGNSSMSSYLKNNEGLTKMTFTVNKLLKNATISIANPPTAPYLAGGNKALIDGMEGTSADIYNFWQGYYNQDISVVVDLNNAQKVDSIGINLLNYPKANIYLPPAITFFYSVDGSNYNQAGTHTYSPKSDMRAQTVNQLRFAVGKKIRYVKIIAQKNDFPVKSWLFADEITIE